MAFLGRTPGKLSLRPVLKQTITSDGVSTDYTLNEECTANAIDLFVNNVRQEPGVSYTVSGTTLSFTEAPDSAASVYIIYQKSVLGAEVLPGPDTLTTAMIKDGAITAAKLATSVDTHDSAAVQAQFDSAFPSAFDTRFALQDTHDSAQVQAQIDSAAVKLTGTQTIAGIKTFSDSANFTGGHLRVYNSTDSEEQVIIAEVSGGFSNGAGISLRRDGTEMGRVNADYFDGMTFHVTDGAGGAATQKARLATNGYFVIGENETPYNLFSVRDSDMGFEVNPNALQEVRLNAYDRGQSTFRTMALQASSVIVRPSGSGTTVDNTTIDGDGIKFNGDTAAANGLDDYEEGTWTPAYSTSNGDASVSSYNTQQGFYIKIGRTVFVSCYLYINSLTSAGTGNPLITGLPFGKTDGELRATFVNYQVATHSSTYPFVTGYNNYNETVVRFLLHRQVGTWTQATTSSFTVQGGTLLSFTATYITG